MWTDVIKWWINQALALMMLLSAARGHGEAVIDQSFEPDGSFIAGGPASLYVHAQTFTVGLTGVLTRIDAPIAVPAPGAGTLSWEVRRTTNGVPSDQVLASGSMPGYLRTFTNSYFEWVRFALPEPGIAVTPGEVLALVVRNSAFSVAWWSGSSDYPVGDPYGRGAHFLMRPDGVWTHGVSDDLGFRTHVEVSSLPPGYPRMFAPQRAGEQLQFSVSGDSNHLYVLERSQDLQIWEPVLTNTLRTTSRTFVVPDAGPVQFYQARVAKRRNTFALLALQDLEANRNTLQTDSFDSSDPNFSTNAQYDSNKRKAGGDFALFGSITSTSRLMQIYGKAWHSRNTTNFLLGPQSSVGDLAWHAGGNTGVQPGWLREDLDGVYPAPQAPAGPGLVPMAGVVGGEAYDYVLTDGFYELSNLMLQSSSQMLVTGRAVLWVRGDLTLAGQAKIQLQSAASHLTIYAGRFSSLAGQGVVGVARPENFVFYGLLSSLQINIQFSPFIGLIYAPKVPCSIGRPNVPNEIMGSCVVSTLTLYGPLKFHFDERLQDTTFY